MASKVLKNIKETNKELKEAVKDQKKEEKEAKKALQEAKSDAGLFASRAEKKKIKEAKQTYQKEKRETKQGKELQKQGKTMEGVVADTSRSMLVFHSDKKLSANIKNEANTFQKQAQGFVSGDTSKANQKSLLSKVGDTVANKIKERIIPDIPGVTDTGSEKSFDGLSL